MSDFLLAALLHFPPKQATILDLFDETRPLPRLDMTEERKERLDVLWEDWNALTVFDDKWLNMATSGLGSKYEESMY